MVKQSFGVIAPAWVIVIFHEDGTQTQQVFASYEDALKQHNENITQNISNALVYSVASLASAKPRFQVFNRFTRKA